MKKGRFCTKCGTKIVDGQIFCANCGREALEDWKAIKKTAGERIGAFFKLLPSILGGVLLLVFIVCAVLFGIRCYGMDEKAVGVWQSEGVYLSAHDAEVVSELTVREDGTWTRVGYKKGTDEKLFEHSGTWTVSGAGIVLAQPEQEGVIIHEYHLNGTFTNGDTVYNRK